MGVKSIGAIVFILLCLTSSAIALDNSGAAKSLNLSFYNSHGVATLKTLADKNSDAHNTNILSGSAPKIISVNPPDNSTFYTKTGTITLVTDIAASCYLTNSPVIDDSSSFYKFDTTGGTNHEVLFDFASFQPDRYVTYFVCQDDTTYETSDIQKYTFGLDDIILPTMALIQRPPELITNDTTITLEASFSDEGLGFYEGQTCWYCLGRAGSCDNNSNWNMTQNTFLQNTSGWYFSGTCSQSFNTFDYDNGQYEFGIWIADKTFNEVTLTGNFTINVCRPNWIANYSWSQCINGSQYKGYIDLNNCEKNYTKPADLTQQCDSFPPIITFNYADNSTISSNTLHLVATTDEMAGCWQSDYYEYSRDDTQPPNISVVSPTGTIDSICAVNILFHTNERADCKGEINQNASYDNMTILFSRSEISLNDYEFTYKTILYGTNSIYVKCRDLSGNVGSINWNFNNVASSGGSGSSCTSASGGGSGSGGGPYSLIHSWDYDLEDYHNYLIEVSCSDNLSNTGHSAVTLNTDFCIPNWTSTNTSCQPSDNITEYYTDMNDCFAKTNSSHDLQGKVSNMTYTCDYCTPNWTVINTSCQLDDKMIEYYNDTNDCFAKTNLSNDLSGKSDNKTYKCDRCTPSWQCSGYASCQLNDRASCNNTSDANSCYLQTNLTSDMYLPGNYSEFEKGYCDYNSDGIIGNTSDMNMTNANITIVIDSGNGTIHFLDDNNSFIEFDYNLTRDKLNLFNITIERQNDSSVQSYVIIRGVDLTGSNKTKTVYFNRMLNGTGLCIKDMEVSSISEVSGTCSNTNEVWLNCPGTASNYNCSFFNNGTEYRVSGLAHSAVQEQSTHCGDGTCNGGESCSSCSIDCGGCPSSPSAPSSGGGGGGYVPPKKTNVTSNSSKASNVTNNTTVVDKITHITSGNVNTSSNVTTTKSADNASQSKDKSGITGFAILDGIKDIPPIYVIGAAVIIAISIVVVAIYMRKPGKKHKR